MSDHCESKRILVDIQDNGIIRRADTGYLIGNLSRDYPFSDLCHGTVEVESRSVQRREALQKGEPMPTFDKPEMPERIWANPQLGEYEPICYDLSYTEYLRADKVRELVRAFDGAKCLTEEKAKKAEELLHALFPEGVERLTNGEE